MIYGAVGLGITGFTSCKLTIMLLNLLLIIYNIVKNRRYFGYGMYGFSLAIGILGGGAMGII